MSLPKFEGKEVIAARVKVAKAGDGLSDALDVEPIALKNGDVVYYVLRGVVSQVNHRPASKDLPAILVRQHTIDCTGITTIDPATAQAMIEESDAKIAAWRAEQEELALREEEERLRQEEEAAGVHRLALDEGTDDE